MSKWDSNGSVPLSSKQVGPRQAKDLVGQQ